MRHVPWLELGVVAFVIFVVYGAFKWTRLSEHDERVNQWLRDKTAQTDAQYQCVLTHFHPEFTEVPHHYRAFRSAVDRRAPSDATAARGDVKRELHMAIQKTYTRPDRHAFRMAAKDLLKSMGAITSVLDKSWDPCPPADERHGL